MSRGGMCRNPFAGFARPDKLDPLRFVGPSDPPEKAVLIAAFLDAFKGFVYFGLGDMAPDGTPRGNGLSAEQFYFDYRYLFVVRSYLPETWAAARVMKDTSIDEASGKRRTRYIELSDSVLKLMCFDRQFELCNFSFSMERFLKMVRDHRMAVLARAGAQIQDYMRLLREFSVLKYAPGHALPLFTAASDVDLRILLEPQSPEEVEDLVGYLPKCFKARHAREHRAPEFRQDVFEAAQEAELKLALLKGPLIETPVVGVSDHPGCSRPGIPA